MDELDEKLIIQALSERSSAVENILKHAFLAELSQIAWEKDPLCPLNISNSEVDDSGYDVVLEYGGIVRHVQLKQAHNKKRPQKYSVRVPFATLPGACVVVIIHAISNLRVSSYSFYGKDPDQPMPYIEAHRTTKHPGRRDANGNRKLRLNYRDALYSKFEKNINLHELFNLLFPLGMP